MRNKVFQDRWKKLVAFDEIRRFKLLEIIQYCFIFFILSLIVSMIMNKTYYYKYVAEQRKKRESKLQRKISMKEGIILIFTLFIEILILTISIFYIRKIVLLVPSIGTFYSNKFKPLTTMNFVINIPLIFVFLELVPEFHGQFTHLSEFLTSL